MINVFQYKTYSCVNLVSRDISNVSEENSRAKICLAYFEFLKSKSWKTITLNGQIGLDNLRIWQPSSLSCPFCSLSRLCPFGSQILNIAVFNINPPTCVYLPDKYEKLKMFLIWPLKMFVAMKADETLGFCRLSSKYP